MGGPHGGAPGTVRRAREWGNCTGTFLVVSVGGNSGGRQAAWGCATCNHCTRLWQRGCPQLSATWAFRQAEGGPGGVDPVKDVAGVCRLWIGGFALGSALVNELLIISRNWPALGGTVLSGSARTQMSKHQKYRKNGKKTPAVPWPLTNPPTKVNNFAIQAALIITRTHFCPFSCPNKAACPLLWLQETVPDL